MSMKEDVSSPGMYRAKYLIDDTQKAKTAKVIYKMQNGPGETEAKITAPAKIKVLNKRLHLPVPKFYLPG